LNRPAKKHSIIVDPVLIVGTGLSVLLAVIFYVREDTAQALGTLAGLIGGVITLQVQTLLKERRRIDHETRVGHMVSTIEKIPWLPDLMEPMLRAAKHVERDYDGTPAQDACRRAFEECLRTLTDLERGHFRSPYGDNEVFLGLIERAREQICVTSVPTVDLAWWREPVGRQYWQAQVDAMARGVVIRRVFIYHEWTDDLDALAREQLQAGVRVRRVQAERLPAAMRVITGVWDGSCGHELNYTAAGEAVHDTFTVSPPDLERLMRQFEMIERSAVELDEPSAPDLVP
jgi:hypothetical protein